MKKLITILFLMGVCSFALLAQDKNTKEKICITEQEYDVYQVAGVGNFRNETIAYPFSEDVESQFAGISPGAVVDFRERNSKTYLLRCVLRRDQKKKKLKTFTETTSTLSFSRIGFNNGETEALVYVAWSGVGNTCGAEFFRLKKENNKWSIVKRVMTVIC